MFMEWRCTCVEVFFNSDEEGSDCSSYIKKIYDILSKLSDIISYLEYIWISYWGVDLSARCDSIVIFSR